MCAERSQRLLTAFVVLLAMVLANTGHLAIATGILIFVAAMLVVWAFTNFCPSLWFFKKVLPPCNWGN